VGAVGVEGRSVAGIEIGVVLHHGDRGLDRGHRRATARENRPSRLERGAQAGAETGLARGAHLRAGDDAAAAMDDEGRNGHARGSFRVLLAGLISPAPPARQFREAVRLTPSP
jgi:hypothetical protein